MAHVCEVMFVVFLVAACTPSGATGTTAEQAKVDPQAACPPGTNEDSSTEAMTDCQGKAGANLTSKSGSISGRCLNKGSSTIKCAADPLVCGTAGVLSITVDGIQCNKPSPEKAFANDRDCGQSVNGKNNIVIRGNCITNRHP